MRWFRRLYFRLLYLRNPPWDTQVSPPELMDFIARHAPGRALDLGCGTGTNVITLAKHGWQATGVDFVGHAIEQAKVKAQHAGIEADFQVDDVTRLKNVRGSFDLILDIGCYHGLDEDQRTLYVKNLSRLTSPGSIYLLYGFLRDRGGKGPGIQETDFRDFEEIFDQVDKELGLDRGERASVWLTYQRKAA